MNRILKINPLDNVAVAISPIKKGEALTINNDKVIAIDNISPGHKISLENIAKDCPVTKYGYTIGFAAENISKGSWIHTHNIKTSLKDLLSYTFEPVNSHILTRPNVEKYNFPGFTRSDGKVGIRNEIWIIPTVGCVNSIAATLERKSQVLITGSVNQVVSFTHPYGCSQLGEDQEYTRKVLAGLVNHPNAGGVLVLGLGCENSNIQVLKEYIGEYDENRVKFLVCQESDDELTEGLSLIEDLIQYASTFQRQPVDVSSLTVGLKCGGSDGFSGITANPLVGNFSDLLISKGGTTILTEVPEMFGAETILMNRCENKDLFNKTVSLINNFKDYYKSYNQPIYENPSPGNKAGGISTLEEKSLGCTQKSGTTPVKGVLEYCDVVRNKGLNLLSAPGNDLVACTALAVSGAQLILFTTGRGTPFASPVPTVKISTNSQMASKKSSWIDFDAGVLLNGKPMEALVNELYDYILSIANGEKVCSEISDYHEMAIFKQGVTL